jgi:hypothetical protein
MSLFINYKMFTKCIRKFNCFLSCKYSVDMFLLDCDALVIDCELFVIVRLSGEQSCDCDECLNENIK